MVAMGARLATIKGLEVRIAPAGVVALEGGEILRVNIVGQDRPGIVNQVTAALSSLAANIEDFETWITAEPHSGRPLFHLDARLRLPPGLTANAVQEALEEISGEIMVDIDLSPSA